MPGPRLAPAARSGCDELLTSGLVLSGGTAELGGICEVAEQVFHIPVRAGAPSGVGGLSDLVSSPQYATAVGLIFYGANSESQSRFRLGRSKVTKAFKKVSNWFGEHF